MTEFLIDRPGAETALSALVLLAHGSGAPMDSEFMVGMAQRLARAGVGVFRFEFPYMAGRRVGGSKRPPDRLPKLQEAMRSAVSELVQLPALSATERNLPLLLAGKSLGGRVASTLADELEVAGLVCLGYPFHPPGKPERLRTEHLLNLRTPTLILQGERDRFGGPEEVASYGLPGSMRVEWVPDGDHGFVPRVRSGRSLEQNLDLAGAAFERFVQGLGGLP